MFQLLLVLQIVFGVALTVLILAQNKDGGLSAVTGSTQSFQSVKRGAEKVIFRATIFFAVAFLLNAILIVFF